MFNIDIRIEEMKYINYFEKKKNIYLVLCVILLVCLFRYNV